MEVRIKVLHLQSFVDNSNMYYVLITNFNFHSIQSSRLNTVKYKHQIIKRYLENSMHVMFLAMTSFNKHGFDIEQCKKKGKMEKCYLRK